MTDRPAGADERLVAQALRLIARAAVAPPESAARAERQLAHWQTRSPAHVLACDEAQRRWAMLGEMAPVLRTHFDEGPLAAPAPMHGRRAVLSWLLVGGASGVLGAAAWQRQQRVMYAQHYRSGVAEQLQATVPDGHDGAAGSQIEIAAQTSLRLALRPGVREAVLDGGEAYFAVAPDADRPFRVDTRLGRVEVLGTAFSVADRGDTIDIAVAHGHVRFTRLPTAGWRRFIAGLGAADGISVQGGEALTVRPDATGAVRALAPERVATWREGWLVFDGVTLDEALPTINAYRRQAIAVADRQVGALRLTGRFRTQGSDDLLAVLPSILPLRATPAADGGVVLHMR